MSWNSKHFPKIRLTTNGKSKLYCPSSSSVYKRSQLFFLLLCSSKGKKSLKKTTKLFKATVGDDSSLSSTFHNEILYMRQSIKSQVISSYGKCVLFIIIIHKGVDKLTGHKGVPL